MRDTACIQTQELLYVTLHCCSAWWCSTN